MYLEAVSKLFAVALARKKFGYEAQRAGNSGSIAKRCNAVAGLFAPNPQGQWLFSSISALLLAHLHQVNLTRRALNCTKTAAGATVNSFETASR